MRAWSGTQPEAVGLAPPPPVSPVTWLNRALSLRPPRCAQLLHTHEAAWSSPAACSPVRPRGQGPQGPPQGRPNRLPLGINSCHLTKLNPPCLLGVGGTAQAQGHEVAGKQLGQSHPDDSEPGGGRSRTGPGHLAGGSGTHTRAPPARSWGGSQHGTRQHGTRQRRTRQRRLSEAAATVPAAAWHPQQLKGTNARG